MNEQYLRALADPDLQADLNHRDDFHKTYNLHPHRGMVSYVQWVKCVDEGVWDILDSSIADIPYLTLRDWYAEGITPHEAVERAVNARRRR